MNEEKKNIWKKSWKGPGAVLFLITVLAVPVCFGALILVALLGSSPQTLPERDRLVAQLLITAAVITVFLLRRQLLRFFRWLFTGRILRRFLFGAACFATLIALFYAEEHWRGKRAWENHRRELEAKGEVFTIAALLPPPVPDQKNFALTPLLKPALDFTRGPAGLVWRDTNAWAHLQNIRAELGPRADSDRKISLGSLEKGTFADLESCRDYYRGNTNFPQPTVSGTAAADILVALGRFAPEIKELREAAATRPSSRFPINYDQEPPWSILLPHLAAMKGLGLLLNLQATAELASNQSEQAFEDLKVAFRLSDSISREPILIDHLVRIAMLAMNLQTLREGLLRHSWSEAQLAELETHLASVDVLGEYKLAMRGERAFGTDGLDFLRRQGFRSEAMNYLDTGGGAAFALRFNLMPGGWYYQNMLTISRMHQDYTLAAVDERSHRVFPGVGDKSEWASHNMRTGPYTIFARQLMPALGKSVRKSARMQAFVDEARVACALERYRLANNRLPDTLEALVPKFLDKIPDDVIDGKPLRYRPAPNGGYVLYSIGWNTTDDSGQVVFSKSETATSKEMASSVDVTKGDWAWRMPGTP